MRIAAVAAFMALGGAALHAQAQVRVLGSVDSKPPVGGVNGAAAALVVPNQTYDSYDIVPTLKDNDRKRALGESGASDRLESSREERAGRRDPGRGIKGRYGSGVSERREAKRAARMEKMARARERADELRWGYPGFVVPYVRREREYDDDGNATEVVETSTETPGLSTEAGPPEFSPAEPMRLRAGQREPETRDDVAAALTITVSASGASVAGVAGALEDKRGRVLRAVVQADRSACIEGQSALDIASDGGTGFRGEDRMALRVADSATVLGVLAALPAETVAGFTTEPDPEGVAAASVVEDGPRRGFQRAPSHRTATVRPLPGSCRPVS